VNSDDMGSVGTKSRSSLVTYGRIPSQRMPSCPKILPTWLLGGHDKVGQPGMLTWQSAAPHSAERIAQETWQGGGD
jgi:hypothetical protein